MKPKKRIFSALTLAAGEIMHQLVLDADKTLFVDNVVKVNDFHNPDRTPKRLSIISHIHK